MKNIIVLLGFTASGKSTIQNILVNNYNYNKITEYTSRPIRENELEETYHFISKEEFEDKIKSDFFLEYRQYNTVHGLWYYGFSKEDFDNINDKSVIIIAPQNYKKIIKIYPNIKDNSYYIYVDENILKERLKLRCDNEESERRLKQDNIDFDGIKNFVSKVIYNNGNIDDVIKEIINGKENF